VGIDANSISEKNKTAESRWQDRLDPSNVGANMARARGTMDIALVEERLSETGTVKHRVLKNIHPGPTRNGLVAAWNVGMRNFNAEDRRERAEKAIQELLGRSTKGIGRR